MEKRDNHRRKIRLSIQAEPGAIRAYTADVSPTGMFVVSAKVFAPGTRLRIIVRTDDGTALGVGVVRWSKRVPPSLIRSTRGGMGVEFTWVSPELQKVLDDALGLSAG